MMEKERNVALDFIRGVALAGILIMNIQSIYHALSSLY